MSVLPPISNNENHYKAKGMKNSSRRNSNTKSNAKLIGRISLSEKQVVVYHSSEDNLKPNNAKSNKNQRSLNNCKNSPASLRLNISVDFNQSKSGSTSKVKSTDEDSLVHNSHRPAQSVAVKKVSVKVSNSPSPEKRPLKKSNVSTGGVTSSQSRKMSSTRTDSNSHNSWLNSSRNQRRIFNSGPLPTTHELNAERIEDNRDNCNLDDEDRPENMERILQWLETIQGADAETEQVVVEEGPRQTDKSIHIIYDG